jgi:penicillin-binding protein 1C
MMRRFLSVGVSLVLIAALALAAATPQMPAFEEVRARWRPSEARLLDRNGDPVHELRIDAHGRRFAWTPLDQVSPALIDAVVAAEDHRFWSHRGVDLAAVCSSAARAVVGRRSRGASTITMQLVSILDPSLGRTSRHPTVVRKVEQALAALALERRWSKREILEAYLNMVTYRGELQGIAAASRVLFGKAPHGIDSAEAVVLASLIRAPNARRETVAKRSTNLSRSIAALGLSRDAVATAVDEVFASRGSEHAHITLAPHLAERMLRGENGDVHCALDRDLQRFVVDALHSQIFDVRDRRVDDGAAIVVENSTGEVWAYVGGAGDLSSAPDFDAVRAPRQPGSALKPFLYALAVDEHLLTAASLLEDTPLELPEQRGLYRPLDYDRQFRGLVSMRTALSSSLNVPAVRTADMVGVEAFTNRLRQLGFDGLVEEGDYYGAALALGDADVSLWQITNAYRTLANGGRYSDLRLTTAGNSTISTQVYSPETAFVISDILSDRASRSVTFGLENNLATRFWSAVKTGTSKDMRDNWCVGYTDKFTVGVWVGNASGAPMRDVTGITGAAPTWLSVMNYLHDRFGSGAIARPADVTASTVSFPGGVEPPRAEWFVAGTEPTAQLSGLDEGNPRILSPQAGMIIALDPDIPAPLQRVVFQASPGATHSRWILDGHALVLARDEFLWTPSPGVHKLSLVQKGRLLETVQFVVRGSRHDELAQGDQAGQRDENQ